MGVSRNKVAIFYLLVAVLFFVFCSFLKKYTADVKSGNIDLNTNILKNKNKESRFVSVLSLFNKNATYCEDLSQNWNSLNMSKVYHDRRPEFENKLSEAIRGATSGEGHSNNFPEEKKMLHALATVPGEVVVCETGFNYGHSAFNFLTANDKVRMFSFDLGSHSYVAKMANSLTAMFGADRLHVEFGDSRTSVVTFKSKNLLPPCDIIFVDGGHTFDIAEADIINLSEHASKDNIIIMDDHPVYWRKDIGAAWDTHLLSNGKPRKEDKFGIVELLRCAKRQNEDNVPRGFVVGRVVRSDGPL